MCARAPTSLAPVARQCLEIVELFARRPLASATILCFAPALLLLAAGCQREVALDLVLVDECGKEQAFSDTRSVEVTLIGRAGFNAQAELTGCVQQPSVCAPVQGLRSMDDLRAALRARAPLFSASPGPDQGLVVTGFRDPDCRPAAGRTDPISLCGYQLATITEQGGQIYVLVACLPGDAGRICWPSQFFDLCR